MTDKSDSQWATQPENCPVMRIPAENIVIVPTINAESDTFFDSLLVSMSHPIEGVQIYYTLDETAPNENAMLYTEPFYVKESTVITAAALQDGRWSRPVDAHYHYIDAQRIVTVENAYSNQYEAGGDKALIDRLRGGQNFRTGGWQGYQGTDMHAIVDLGSEQELHRFGAGFLQDAGAWIWMPREVEFLISTDGEHYESLGTATSGVDPTDMTAQTIDIMAPALRDDALPDTYHRKPTVTKARYLQVIARNLGTIPEWHPGAGEQTFFFIDEIIWE